MVAVAETDAAGEVVDAVSWALMGVVTEPSNATKTMQADQVLERSMSLRFLLRIWDRGRILRAILWCLSLE